RPSLGLFDRTGSVLSQLDVPGTDFRDQRTLKVSPDGKQVLFHFDSDDDKSLAAFDISKRALDLSPARRPELIAPALRDFQSRIGRVEQSQKFEENVLQLIGSKPPAALPLHATLAVSGLEATGTSATSMPQAL